ncbi:uncharacterized protein [Saccopteryx bilineata]|uniref:uncharacterized protein n=1 Tax=Saccopteryx bilineata TaxID=59482 RepID=UPI00338F9389
MGPRLLHCVALCLLGAGHVGAMVTQNPRYQVTRMGNPVAMNCSQDLNHDTMYWYQQKLSQAPKLLFHYYDQEFNNETDTSDNFQPSRANVSFSTLGIRSPGLGDSALYLCASSRGTELDPHLPLLINLLPDPRALPPVPPQQQEESTMCTVLICPMVLGLLGAEEGHDYVYWYQQILAKEFKFLVSFQFKKVSQTEMPKERFSAECPEDAPCSLEIKGTELQDSATYFCASSDPQC